MSAYRILRFGVLLSAATIAAACGSEIDSRPESEEPSARQAGAAEQPSPSPGTAEQGYRTHLYSEHDADVYGNMDPDDAGEGTIVKATHVEVGRNVGAGQVLAILEDTRQRLDVEAAQARADEAHANAERAKELLAQEMVPRAEFESLQNAEREAQAELKQAQFELAQTRVRAPFSGVISRRYIRVGERVEPQTPLFRVTAMAPLRARLLVPEEEASAFRPGATARVTGLDGVATEARVLFVSPTVDAASGTREIVLQLTTTAGFLPGAEIIVIAPDPDEDGE
jgi:membrane fusion protein (multidrug efflux system)